MSREDEQLIFAALALILQKLRSASIQADQESIDMVKRLDAIGDSSEHKGWPVVE